MLQGSTSTSTATSAALRLNATVTGLGPIFKLTLELCNSDSQPMLDAALVSSYAFLSIKHIFQLMNALHGCTPVSVHCVLQTGQVLLHIMHVAHKSCV